MTLDLPRPDFFIILIARWSALLLQGFCIFATSFEIAGELANTPTSQGAEGITFFQRVATKLKCMNGYSFSNHRHQHLWAVKWMQKSITHDSTSHNIT